MRPRSRAISARRSCSSSAERLMMRASSPSSSSRPHADAGREVAARELARGLHDLAERAAETAREQQRHEPARGERHEARERGAAPQRPALRLDPLDAAAQPRDPDDPARAADRDRRVQQPHADRRARALGPRDLAGERAHHLGAAAVVLDRRELGARQRRVGEHAPVRADDRHPRVHLARRRVDQAVELVVRRAASERVLDHPRHQAGLGGQAGEGVVARAPLERRARDEQQHRRARRRSPPRAVITMRPRKDSLRLTPRSPARNDSRAI